MLSKAIMQGCIPVDSPIGQDSKFLPDQREFLDNLERHMRLVTKLIYITIT